MTHSIVATYRVRCRPNEIERLGRDIAIEQTVEVPEDLIATHPDCQGLVGVVQNIVEDRVQTGTFQVTIAYDVELSNYQLPQLLNLLHGNVSIKSNVTLLDAELPEAFLKQFTGPRFGIDGLRALLGVYGRPLVATALKPRGSSTSALAEIAREFSLGGGDIIKDDHNLVDTTLQAFRERVARCQDAVTEANAQTGRNCLYFPNVLAPRAQMEKQAECALALSVHGVMVSPAIAGLDTVRELAEMYPLAVMAHPTFGGAMFTNPAHGIAPEFLLGTLFRLAGCDLSIFPNYGGRFSLTREDCLSVASHLRRRLGALRTSLPAPAGGMQLDRVASLADTYGADSAFLIGGALLSHPSGVRAGTESILGAIRACFNETLPAPLSDFVSSCELTPGTAQQAIREYLVYRGDFSWDGREPIEYKASDELPFAGVSRVELIGKHGERTAFDLRYFEVKQGGFTSLERHLHTHTVMCIRGEGVLMRGGSRTALKLFDIAYIGPLETHQLRNEAAEPFGFLCIVDHDRDRPMRP